MPKRPYEEDNERPITPDAINPDDNRLLTDEAAEASLYGPLPIDNVASTSPPLASFNMPSSSASHPRFNFGPTAPPTQAAISGYSLAGARQPEYCFGASAWPAHKATTYNQNQFELQQIEAEKAYDTEEQLKESREQGNKQDNTPGQVDGERAMEEDDWNEEPEDNASYMKNVLMVMDFRDAETDDPFFD